MSDWDWRYFRINKYIIDAQRDVENHLRYLQAAAMIFVAMVSTALLSIMFLWIFPRFRDRNHSRLPPGPPALPVIGNLHQLMNRSPPHVNLWYLSKIYGRDLMTIKTGKIRTVVVSSARIAREVFKTNDVAFSGRPSHAVTKALTFNCSGIVWAPYGHYWRDLRKISVMQLFSSKKVQSFSSVRHEEAARLISNISSATSVVNLTDLIHSYANNILFRVAFRKRFDDRLQGDRLHNICKDVEEAFVTFSFADYFPLLAWADRLTGLRRLVNKAFDETYSFIQEVIDEHRCSGHSSGEEEDLTDVLIRLKNDGTTITHDNQMKAILGDIIVAGTETSSATLVWVMTELMKNPRALSRAQEELRNTLGQKDENALVDEEDIRKLPYMKAVIKETFRLDPVTPLMVPRQVIERCTIDGYDLPPGLEVCVNTWAIGRDPAIWDRPDEFWPERFMGKDIDSKEEFGFLPFGAGRRSCPGMTLGTATIELALANLLYWFDWKLPHGMTEDDISMETFTGIVAQKKTPLCLSATKYRPPA